MVAGTQNHLVEGKSRQSGGRSGNKNKSDLQLELHSLITEVKNHSIHMPSFTFTVSPWAGLSFPEVIRASISVLADWVPCAFLLSAGFSGGLLDPPFHCQWDRKVCELSVWVQGAKLCPLQLRQSVQDMRLDGTRVCFGHPSGNVINCTLTVQGKGR